MTRDASGTRRPPRLVRIIRARKRLFSSFAVGIVVAQVLRAMHVNPATRFLLGWDIATALYLGLVFEMMVRAEVHHIRWHAATQDEGRVAILVLTVAAALASLAAIFAELATPPGGGGRQPAQLVVATITILLSWAFIHTMFALHYAHEFYTERQGRGGGLRFPGGGEPDYWDFVYFSFVIGMTSQVSDVMVADGRIRRLVVAHGVVSFVFNAALLALTVNIAANAI